MVSIPENAFTLPIQLRFIDTDQARHINHAVFISYLEAARVEWIKTYGQGNEFIKIPIIIARVEIDYILPILFSHKVKVSMWVSKIGNKSFEYEYIIHGIDLEGNELIYAKAKTTQVYFDYKNQVSMIIPEKEREVLSRFNDGQLLS